MPEKISIIRDSGETLNSNVVALFTIPENGKKYIITTENAVDPHGLTVLHVSEIVEGVLKKIATDEEWSSIKTIMRSIISGSVGSFEYIPIIKTAKAEAQYSRDISVSAAASQQIIDSYLANKPAEAEEVKTPVEEVKDTDEITPGISEVVAPVEENAPATSAVEPSVGDAVTNISSSDMITTPLKEESSDEKKEEEKATVVENESKEESKEKELKEEVPVQNTIVQTPVVAYVDPAFQQLLTSDYNQILMHVQNINNNINQIAAMPALNYQPSYSANQNGTPNFNPNATVDEIISGSTEVFNEGVKNLVATITEKLYRDLYQREIELTKREEMLLEREKIVNQQLASLEKTVTASSVTQTSVPVTTPQIVETKSVDINNVPVVEEPSVNVIDASVKLEENVVPAQQNTAPVAEPVVEKQEVISKEEVKQVSTPITNNVPQPVQTVEIV